MLAIVNLMPLLLIIVTSFVIVCYLLKKIILHFSDTALINSQIVSDEFDDYFLLTWIKENRPATDIKILVVKPTAFWVRNLGLIYTERIDTGKNLIGCIIDNKTEKILTMRLFNFRSMSNKMFNKFGKHDEILLHA